MGPAVAAHMYRELSLGVFSAFPGKQFSQSLRFGFGFRSCGPLEGNL